MTCFVNVSDVFGGVSSATSSVNVYPPNDVSAVTDAANEQWQTFLIVATRILSRKSLVQSLVLSILKIVRSHYYVQR